MFVSFNPILLLAWIFLSSFLPGALISLSVFRKDEFSLLERILIGFGIGMILLPLIPFLLYLVLGIKYSFGIAAVSVAVLYAIALAAFVLRKGYDGLIGPDTLRLSADKAVPAFLALLLVASFLARVGSYSPVFQELDPYFYTFTAHQLLTLGENPPDDQTSWYPDVVVNHRIIPEISYLESIWYSLYTMGGPNDNMLLAVIASVYPPIAAALAVFFIYLLVSSTVRREFGLIAAALAGFAPIFVIKLAAGEQEVQPYAFFALAFFFSMYALSLKRKDILRSLSPLSLGPDLKYSALAGLGFAAISLGSSSQILAMLSIVIFLILYAIIVYLRDKDAKELESLLVSNSIMLLIGPLLGSAILKDVFSSGSPSLSMLVPILSAVLFIALLYALKKKVAGRQNSVLALAAVLLLGLIVFAATPVGDYIRNAGKAGFGIAQFNRPLDRTIAEQGVAPAGFSGQMGSIAAEFSLPPQLDSIGALASLIGFVIFTPFSIVANLLLWLFVGAVNLFLGTSVDFGAKDTSLLLFWILLFLAAAAFLVYRYLKKEEDGMALLFLAIVMPPLAVGLIKAKYTIYAAVLLSVAVGFSLGKMETILPAFVKDKETVGKAAKYVLYLGIALALLQFTSNGFAPSLIWGSFQPLYQNDPMALAGKFQAICSATNDTDVCQAAADPMGYASRGTNYQYDYKLCLLSIFSNYQQISTPGAAPPWETQSAFFRCQRISDYWIDSMEWVKENTEPGARITSWWDYGHWINYFGDRNAVIRNEHASTAMIGEVAHGYVDATPAELKAWMSAHDSKYALFDAELVMSGSDLGGKYGALNYLSCAYHNLTSVAKSPGESQCEADHLWETVFISNNPCTISNLTGKTGYLAYHLYSGASPLPDYPSFCMSPQDQNTLAYCRDAIRAEPAYCAGEVMLADGQTTIATYYLNETYPNGDLKLNKAILQLPRTLPSTYHFGPAVEVTMFYTEDSVWLENGQVVSGYADRKGLFYDSALYRGFFLDDLPGFKLVYTTPDGAVKIYKMQ